MILPLGTPLISVSPTGTTVSSPLSRLSGVWVTTMMACGFGEKGNTYDAKASKNGLLVMNHEYVNSSELSPFGYHVISDNNAAPIYQNRRLASDVRRSWPEVAVVEMTRRADGMGYEMVKDSKYNRRITSSTPAQLTGPVAGSDLVKTKFDPTGLQTRGINNNCGAGLSPWGTYLTTKKISWAYLRVVKTPAAKRSS